MSKTIEMEPGIAIPILPARSLGCYWRVRDPDAIYAEMKQGDFSASPWVRVTPIEDKPWGTREFALIDPNGNLVRIGAPRDW